MGISYNFLDIEKWENESMKQYLLKHKVASLVVVLLSFWKMHPLLLVFR